MAPGGNYGPMFPDDLTATVDELHKELGRFVVNFSRFTHACQVFLEISISYTFTESDDPAREALQELAAIAIGEKEANALLKSFCAAFTFLNQPTDEDVAILKAYRKKATTLIERRNRIAHDSWFIGWHNEENRPGDYAIRVQSQRITKGGREVEAQHLSVVDLRALADEAGEVAEMTTLIGMTSGSSNLEISKVLDLENGELRMIDRSRD